MTKYFQMFMIYSVYLQQSISPPKATTQDYLSLSCFEAVTSISAARLKFVEGVIRIVNGKIDGLDRRNLRVTIKSGFCEGKPSPK